MQRISSQHPVVTLAPNRATTHCCPSISPESFSVVPQVLRRFLVEGIRCVGLEEQKLAISSACGFLTLEMGQTYLHADDDGVQVQHRLPVFS